MFNIDETPIFTQTVKVTAPGGLAQDFKATFEALDVDDFAAFDLSRADQTKAFLERVLQSVEDIVDGAGNPVLGGPELRERLLRKSWVRQGLVTAYLEGHRPAQAGN